MMLKIFGVLIVFPPKKLTQEEFRKIMATSDKELQLISDKSTKEV
jgi:hypothetical protein